MSKAAIALLSALAGSVIASGVDRLSEPSLAQCRNAVGAPVEMTAAAIREIEDSRTCRAYREGMGDALAGRVSRRR